jgi:hypothetical protein
MLAKTKKAKSGKIKTAYLIILAVFFLGAYFWKPSFGQNNATTGQKAAAVADKAKLPPNPVDQVGQVTPGVEKQEEFHPFAPLREDRYTSMEKIGLWVVLGIAVLGLLYAGMLVGRRTGQTRRPGHSANAGNRRRRARRR